MTFVSEQTTHCKLCILAFMSEHTGLWLHVQSVYMCDYVCVLIYLLPGVKVSHNTVPEGTFYTVEAETLEVFLGSHAHCCIDTPGPHKWLHVIPFHFSSPIFFSSLCLSNKAEIS